MPVLYGPEAGEVVVPSGPHGDTIQCLPLYLVDNHGNLRVNVSLTDGAHMNWEPN